LFLATWSNLPSGQKRPHPVMMQKCVHAGSIPSLTALK
jgi:hypothetical protein